MKRRDRDRDLQPPGPHDKPLEDQDRVVLDGRRLDDGSRCTVILIRDRDGLVFYPHGAAGLAVRLVGEQVKLMQSFVTGGQS